MGKDRGPWGKHPGKAGGSNGKRPDYNPEQEFEKLFKDGQDKIKQMFSGGKKSGGGDDEFKPDGKSFVVLAVVALLIWLATGYYKVDVSEKGVEILLGEYNDTKSSGLQWHLPYPIEKVEIVDVTSIRTEEIGYRSSTNNSRGSIFSRNDQYKSSKGGNRSILEESLMFTGDENIADIHAEVQWIVSNPHHYLFNVRNSYGENTVKSAAESALREIIGRTAIVKANEGRSDIEHETKQLLQDVLNSYDAGIEIVRLQLLKVDPPSTVIDAYRDVQTSKADKERKINEAKAYSNDIIPRAEGQAQQIILESEGYKESTIANAKGQAQRFIDIHKQYAKAKNVTKKRIYIETMESVLENTKKIIIEDSASKSGVVPYLPLSELNKK